jgi:uncharacterized protein
VSGAAPPGREGFVPGRHAIDAYGAGGFRFAGMSHRGSILALPSGIHAWEASDPARLTKADFAPVLAEAAAIELLLIGTGGELVRPAAPILDRLREAGIAVEPMQTGPAARTYNVLVGEDRRVAAALLAVP